MKDPQEKVSSSLRSNRQPQHWMALASKGLVIMFILAPWRGNSEQPRSLPLSPSVALTAESSPGTITGRLVAPPDCPWNLAETKAILQEQLPPFPIPPTVQANGRRAEDEWFQKWKATEAGQAFLSQPRKRYDIAVSSDGSFRLENIALGNYWLSYSFYDASENERVSGENSEAP